MERLTKPDSDYCHDICGSVNGCPRLTGGKKRCRGYDLYERLKWYENLWPSIRSITINSGVLGVEEARDIFNRLLNDERLYLAELDGQAFTPKISDDEIREGLQKVLSKSVLEDACNKIKEEGLLNE